MLVVYTNLHESWSKLSPIPLYLSKEFQGVCETPKMVHSILHVCMYVYFFGGDSP